MTIEQAFDSLCDLLCEEPQSVHRSDPASARVTLSFKSRIAAIKASIGKDAVEPTPEQVEAMKEDGAYSLNDGTYQPGLDERYWTLEAYLRNPIVGNRWRNDEVDSVLLSRKLVFRTEVGARAKARSLGWI